MRGWQVIVVATGCVVLGAAAARAQEFADNPLIAQGISLYNDLEYEASVDALQRALVRAENVPEQKIAIFNYLALDYLVLERTEDAEEAFRQLLAIRPEYALDPALFSPAHREFLEGVRRRWEAEGRPGWVSPDSRLRPVTVNHDLPAEAVREQSLEVSAQIEDPDARTAQVVLAFRAAGESEFQRVAARPLSPVAWSADIPGDRINPPVIEYYLEALDGQGRVVGRRGDERSPLRVLVPGEEEGSIVTRWWFWTLIGVGVAAAVAVPVGVVYGGGGGGSDPATVTVVLCDPAVPGDCD